MGDELITTTLLGGPPGPIGTSALGDLQVLRSNAFEQLNACAALLDGGGVIVDTNEAWRLFAHLNDGEPSATGVGVNYLDVCDRAAAVSGGGAAAASVGAGLRSILAGDCTRFDFEYPCGTPSEERWHRLQASSAAVSGGSGVVLFHVDITAIKLREIQLEHQAERDSLTGLPNRAGAHRYLTAALAGGESVTVMFVDLDGFKLVKDNHGHHAGDELLAKVSSRLRGAVRAGDTVCRFGGDEFVVICSGLGPEQASSIKARMAEVMAPPFQVGADAIEVGASVGWATSAPGSTVESLLRSADAEMYAAKASSPKPVVPDADRVGNVPRLAQVAAPPAATSPDAVAQTMQHLALVDDLTGLPNRNALVKAVADVGRICDPSCDVGLILFDLDDFCDVNDTLGHDAGDELLTAVAQRVREVVPNEFLVARFAGDQFAVFGQTLSCPHSSRRMAATVKSGLTQAFPIAGYDLITSATMGIAVAPSHRADELIRNADAALYHAKKTDRGGTVHFRPQIADDADRRLRRTGDLRRAVSRGEIVPFYQPVVDLDSGRVVGVEALARWNHPEHGWVPPDEFIPLAEATGIIEELGQQIVERSCADAAQWLRQGRPLKLAVNASGVQLTNPSFVTMIEAALHAAGLPPSQLTIEITETKAVSDPALAIAALMSLRERSIALSLDDFGTGYSPLAALRDLPVAAIKLDRTFVAGLGSPTGDRLAVGIIQLGLAVGVHVIAEGVETQAHSDQLREVGCAYGQGYLWSPAVPGDELLATVARIERMPLGT